MNESDSPTVTETLDKVKAASPSADDANKEVVKSPPTPLELYFQHIGAGDLGAVGADLTSGVGKVDIVDEHGMSPLQHAAYRGNKEMCQLLLDQGASVNYDNHSNRYTALHFAALSGKAPVCQLLLQQGANPQAVNSVGRTAAQMAAFVGNHPCVSTINNFLNKEDVEYFSVPQGLEKTSKLDPHLVTPLHNLIMQVNFHPVRVAMSLCDARNLLASLPEIVRVLPIIVQREVKKGSSTNEFVAFKVHLISHFLTAIASNVEDRRGTADGNEPISREEAEKWIESYVKPLLTVKQPAGIPDALEVILREGVRSFPYHDLTVLHQLVTNLNHTKFGEDPGAWAIIRSVINGQTGFRDNDPCATCAEERGAKKCSRCHFDAYCNSQCQKLHWFMHKKYCKRKAEEFQARKKAREAETCTKE